MEQGERGINLGSAMMWLGVCMICLAVFISIGWFLWSASIPFLVKVITGLTMLGAIVGAIGVVTA